MALASKVDILAWTLRAALTIFNITVKLMQDNKLIIVTIIN